MVGSGGISDLNCLLVIGTEAAVADYLVKSTGWRDLGASDGGLSFGVRRVRRRNIRVMAV
jgi:hypothetical protein